MTPARKIWVSVLAVAAVQTTVLASMVWGRVSLLRSGREIVLNVVPVDPRSLFQGDYVQLAYGISRIPRDLLPQEMKNTEPVYVTLARDGEGKWNAVRATPDKASPAKDGEITINGTARTSFVPGLQPGFTWVDYGIEQYFVPEGKGRDIEALVGDKRISALIAVGTDGTAAIKGLIADGQLVFSEPLF